MNIGVLAVQGAFIEHVHTLERLGVGSFEIRQKADLLKPLDGLILPGGESTAMGKVLRDLDMLATLREYIQAGMPVLGTCAGMILLAKEIDDSDIVHLGTMDITVVRNAYGRQLGSFNHRGTYGSEHQIEMPFIRAPYIKAVGAGVEILTLVDNRIVAARQNKQLAVAFHPELTPDTTVHEHLIELVGSR